MRVKDNSFHINLF